MPQRSFDTVLQRLYEIFSSYSLSERFGDCDWLPKETVQSIRSKQLRTLNSQDLSLYAIHAWRCGNEDDFKYLLPRMLELFASGDLDYIVVPELFLGNLPHSTWPEVEGQAVDSFLMELWLSLINTFPFPYDPDEFLCGLAQIYPDLKQFLDAWQINSSQSTLRQLALFAAHATYCGGWEQRPVQKQQITEWLLRPVIIETLEKAGLTYKDQPFNTEFLEAISAIKRWKNAFNSE